MKPSIFVENGRHTHDLKLLETKISPAWTHIVLDLHMKPPGSLGKARKKQKGLEKGET